MNWQLVVVILLLVACVVAIVLRCIRLFTRSGHRSDSCCGADSGEGNCDTGPCAGCPLKESCKK